MTLEEFIKKDEALARAIANKRLKEIDSLFQRAIARYVKLYQKCKWINNDDFTLNTNPALKKEIEQITANLAFDLGSTINSATKEQWLLAQATAVKFGETYFDISLLKKATQQIFRNTHLKEYDYFLNRKLGDFKLSKRVWRYTQQFEGQMVEAISLALKNGDSAQVLSRDIKKYLNNPDALFRRVRDEKGQLHLSKNAKLYNPGQGVYRSAHKNAMRLAGSEINAAYKKSENTKWQSLDFVMGFEIKLSNNHTLNGRSFVDICDDLKGFYPKTFVFSGWHPSCRCYQIAVLKPIEMFTDELKNAVKSDYSHLEGYKTPIKEMPQNFKDHLNENKVKYSGWKVVPYWAV